MSLVISFIICLVCSFALNLSLMIRLSRHGRNRLKPFIYGTISMLIISRVILKYVYLFTNAFYSGRVHFTNNKIFYGICNNLVTALVIDGIIYEIIWFLNYFGKWTSTISRNFTFGLGIGWAYSLSSVGFYCIELLEDYFKGNLYWFGITDLLYVWNMLIESVFYTFIFITAVFLIEYGIIKGKGGKCVLIVVGLHAFIGMETYFIPYVFDLPAVISDIIAIIITYFAFKKSYYLLRKEQYHHRRK